MDRRHFLAAGLAAGLAPALRAADAPADLHRQLLDRAARLEERRRERFAAVNTAADADALRKSLRSDLLEMVGGLPERATRAPMTKSLGTIDGGDHVIEKLAFESLPGYWVSALLYRPAGKAKGLPAVLSPCGHSAVGKAAGPYQSFHVGLARRGLVVLTYDPVGQAERSQFWEADRGRSRFNLVCGEHAVLGTPLYLLGQNLARYRVHDGLRGLDLLAARPEVDPERLGCAGNSGGGTLTAYIAALDDRVRAAVIACYLTTLPRRMASRIADDPDTDPEQDLFGFLAVDHAGLLALRVPRPTLIAAARQDFFPIEGTRATFAEAKRLYEASSAGDRIALAEADEKHGLTLPLRQAAYAWLERWLTDRKEPDPKEADFTPRPPEELRVCAKGQVRLELASRHLFAVVRDEQKARPVAKPRPLKEVFRPDAAGSDFRLAAVTAGKPGMPLLAFVNGNRSPDWAGESGVRKALQAAGLGMAVVDVRGVGALRPDLVAKGHEYADPFGGVEADLAANAFLVGTSLVALRVADVLGAVAALRREHRPGAVLLAGRADAALVAVLVAACDDEIGGIAAEGLPATWWDLFDEAGRPVSGAEVVPGLLQNFGDIGELLAVIRPRKVWKVAKPLADDPAALVAWAKGG